MSAQNGWIMGPSNQQVFPKDYVPGSRSSEWHSSQKAMPFTVRSECYARKKAAMYCQAYCSCKLFPVNKGTRPGA